MEKVKITFDLKFGKLEHKHWEREDKKKLAYELYQQQGNYRYSIENRLFILFDNSQTSSVAFLEKNETIMLQEVIKMLKEPEKYWFKLSFNNQEILTCVILIPEKSYFKIYEAHQPTIGEGLREQDKAIFAHKFLQHASWVSDGQIEPYKEPKQHGIDGYIYLPKEVAE